MVIDLPASSQITARGNLNPVTQVVNQRLETLLAALKALNIQSGETLTALVKAIHPVDEALRARLIQQATPPSGSATAGANRNPTAPETAASQTTAPQTNVPPTKAPQKTAPQTEAPKTIDPNTLKLLHSPNLKLVEVEVQGKALLVFTDRALRPDQTLTLQLQHNQLMLLADKPAAPAYQTHLSTGVSLPAAQGNPVTGPTVSTPLTTAQLNTLQQALRTHLPLHADAQASPSKVISDSLLLAQLLTRLMDQPGSEPLKQQIPRSLQESLHQLAAHLRSPQQLAQPSILKHMIRGSGVQLEHQLGQSVFARPPDGWPPLPQTDVKAALLHALKQLSSYTRSGPATPPALPHNSAPVAAAATPAQPGSPAASALPLIAALQQLLQGPNLQRRSAVRSLSADKIMQAAQQQVLHALDKLLYLQLLTLQQRSLQHSRPHQEGLNTVHVQMELPVNFGFGAHSLSLSIDEDWVTDYSGDSEERREKVQQWQVKLRFELPEAGSLHAHLTVIQQQLSASLWAEDSVTFNKTRASLQSLRQQLEKDGCEVKHLECFHGRPVTEEPARLHSSLIDIQT